MIIIHPEDRVKGYNRKIPASKIRKEMAIEAANRQYFQLECGHYTTLEIQEFWEHWHPKPYTFFCENDTNWVRKMPSPERPTYPIDPLF